LLGSASCGIQKRQPYIDNAMTIGTVPMQGADSVAIEICDVERQHHEIVHFYSDDLLIGSRHRTVTVQRGAHREVIKLPRRKLDIFGFSRLFRRALRLDKCNVFPLDPFGHELVIIRGGAVFRYCQGELRKTLTLKLARNILHTDLCIAPSGRLFFGEYGANRNRMPIPIYVSNDKGASWQVAYEIPGGKAKHVHGVYADKYSDRIWIFTGDENGESWVIHADENFSDVHYIGDGSQTFRACEVFFTPNKVVWAMDSPVATSRMVHFDRQSGSVEQHFAFPGPVWYGRELPGKGFIVASTVEPGESVVGDTATLYFSKDLVEWSPVSGYRKDMWPGGIFKFGVIGFSRGNRADGGFYIFGEALEGLDGQVRKCKTI
jgi:hypothetical protein